MALRTAPKRNSVDYQKLDDLQREIFGSEITENKENKITSRTTESEVNKEVAEQNQSEVKTRSGETDTRDSSGLELDSKSAKTKAGHEKLLSPLDDASGKDSVSTADTAGAAELIGGEHLSDLEMIARRIVSSKAGQGRNTTRPFSLPRTLIIDTTRLKSKFRTIDEQFTQNVIVDFLLREALSKVTPENYKDLRAMAFASVKRADETTRRSLTITEEVIYQMSELKAGINLATGRKYSNDEIFSMLLALAISWLYRNDVLT